MEFVLQFLLSVNLMMKPMVNVLHVSQVITWPMENVLLPLKTSVRLKMPMVAQLVMMDLSSIKTIVSLLIRFQTLPFIMLNVALRNWPN